MVLVVVVCFLKYVPVSKFGVISGQKQRKGKREKKKKKGMENKIYGTKKKKFIPKKKKKNFIIQSNQKWLLKSNREREGYSFIKLSHIQARDRLVVIDITVSRRTGVDFY